MSVLIVKRAALGDVLRTTSLLPALRRKFGGPIWWITDAAAEPLLENHALIDRVLVSGERLKRRFDLALSLEEDADCARWSARAGEDVVGVIVRADGSLGYTARADPYYGMSLLRDDKAQADALKAANTKTFAQLWHGVLKLPAPKGARPALSLSSAERAAARRALALWGLARARPVGLNAGAGGRWPSKQLEEPAAAALARALTALGRPVLLLGGREELARNARIAAAAGAGVFVQKVVGLRVFAAVVERCAAVATTDTLAAHVAAAVGAPVVVLVGPTSAAELDLGPRGLALTPRAGCACFYAPRCRRATHCLSLIEPARVVAALRRLSR